MKLWRRIVPVVAAAGTLSLVTACMTFETPLPGTLDLRTPLALPQDEQVEPKRPAFGDDGIYEGFVLTEEAAPPTSGDYASPQAGTEVYRRVMRQWFIIGLFPILADPGLVTSELETELAKPGTKATQIRITSGFDLVEFGRLLCLSPIPVVQLVNLAPGRVTEVAAFIEGGGAEAATPTPMPPPAS